MPQGAVPSSVSPAPPSPLPCHVDAASGSCPLWRRAFSPLTVGPEGRLEFWGAAKPQALQQRGWGSVGHMEMLRGRGDDGIYVVGVKDSAQADASKPDLISGK